MNTVITSYELKLDDGTSLTLSPVGRNLRLEHRDKSYDTNDFMVPITSLQFIIEHLQKVIEDQLIEKL